LTASISFVLNLIVFPTVLVVNFIKMFQEEYDVVVVGAGHAGSRRLLRQQHNLGSKLC
jgi:hypothetical protein